MLSGSFALRFRIVLRKPKVFLLSPANLAGIRAGYVTRPESKLDLACRLRASGVQIGDLFSFISGLYFRGKLGYARAFSAAPFGIPGAYVITSSAGLLPPETLITLDRVLDLGATDIDAADAQYRGPLLRDCRSLSESLAKDCEIILLGSIATPKYVDPLLQIFAERLLFPAEFVGRGDMSRGGLMLRAVEAGTELTYVPVLNATRHGQRPPKLDPISKNASRLPARMEQ